MSAERPPAPAEPRTRPLTPGSHYSVTFSAADEGCRGYSFAHDGVARLVTDEEGRSVFELETFAADPYAGLNIQRSTPQRPASRSTLCRWAGSPESSPAGHRARLLLETPDERCGATQELTIECRSERSPVADAQGVQEPLAVVSCRIQGSTPSVLWVLVESQEIVLAAEGLRSELRQVTMGMTRRQLVRTSP